ncbi:MAG: molybdenum cofactor biosynthesis protein MoaE [Aestuariivirgaceae bacterium]|nr:molybdenum cofactor biosynthesis protein MoaE [Aestuariivirgaceae bacterium]
MIRVQAEPFDAGAELSRIKARAGTGACVLFCGTVREMSGDTVLSSMTLEHYPGMTETALEAIEAEARARWPLLETLIIHRHGTLLPGDDIVLVIASSAHRQAAFEACHFLIDWLKTKAPFWKREASADTTQWVAAKPQDDAAAQRWKT